MKSLKELDAIVNVLIQGKLPTEQILFMNRREKKETDDFLKTLGSSGVNTLFLRGTDIIVSRIIYKGFQFNIVETDFDDGHNRLSISDSEMVRIDDKIYKPQVFQHSILLTKIDDANDSIKLEIFQNATTNQL